MKRELTVKSTVIDWQDQTLEVKTTAIEKHMIPLSWTIEVTMIGYPDRETKTLIARDLEPYMSRGYIILAACGDSRLSSGRGNRRSFLGAWAQGLTVPY